MLCSSAVTNIHSLPRKAVGKRPGKTGPILHPAVRSPTVIFSFSKKNVGDVEVRRRAAVPAVTRPGSGALLISSNHPRRAG